MSSGTIVKTAQKLAPVSTEALAVAKRLGLNLGKKRVPVTVLVNNVSVREDKRRLVFDFSVSMFYSFFHSVSRLHTFYPHRLGCWRLKIRII